MARRKNTAEAYEVLLRIARKQEESRRREEARRGARGLPRAGRSAAVSSREAPVREGARGSRGALLAGPEAGAAAMERERRAPADLAPRSAPSDRPGAFAASDAGRGEEARFAGLRRPARVPGSRGVLVRRTRPRGDLALARGEAGVDPALVRNEPAKREDGAGAGHRLVARPRERAAFLESAGSPVRGAGDAARGGGRGARGAATTSAEGLLEREGAGGVALETLDAPGAELLARSRLPADAPEEVAEPAAEALGNGDGGERDGESENGGARRKSGSPAGKTGGAKASGKTGGAKTGGAKTGGAKTGGAKTGGAKASGKAGGGRASGKAGGAKAGGGRKGASASAKNGAPRVPEDPATETPPSGVTPRETAEPDAVAPASPEGDGAPGRPSLEAERPGEPVSVPAEEGAGTPEGSPSAVAAGGECLASREGLEDPAEGDLRFPESLGHFDHLGPPGPRTAVAGELLLALAVSALAVPLRLVRWLAGDTVANALGRPVEVRPATLVMGSLALVIVLASIGIYINRHSGSPAPVFTEGSFAPWEAPDRLDPGAAPEAGSEAGSSAGRSGSRDAPGRAGGGAPPGDLWATPGVPSPPGPGIRELAGAGASPDGGKGYWIKVRSKMRLWECEDVLEHLEKTQLYLEHELSPPDADRSVAHKELVAYLMDEETEELYWIFVGPFKKRSEAEGAKEELIELTRTRLVFRNRWETEHPEYFAGAYVVRDSGSISRHRWRLEGTASAPVEGPPRG